MIEKVNEQNKEPELDFSALIDIKLSERKKIKSKLIVYPDKSKKLSINQAQLMREFTTKNMLGKQTTNSSISSIPVFNKNDE